MSKSKHQIIFVCKDCGEEYLRWQGKCANCGQWNTLFEFKAPLKKLNLEISDAKIVELDKIEISNFKRIPTSITEFDRVLGGGIVPGSVILVGGDPGIGKSTLMLQLASGVENILYVSGEESLEQLKMRFDRLGLKNKNLKILAEINIDQVILAAQKEKPALIVIDSIQTVYSADFPSTPGSLVQVRECALKIQQFAKSNQTAVVLVGHVTKEGTVAGPRTLEHLVDVVLYLEGERFHQQRILRGAKNRFGTTDEIGIFEMTEKGLIEVSNPSKIFLAERQKNVPGNVVTATVEGSRVILVEVQGLTSRAVFGYPQRRTSGFDLNRLQLMAAILERQASLNLANQDIFVNVVGGIKIYEPAVDLAVALAIFSSYKAVALDWRLCVFGELGLSGEIRKVSFEAKRKTEAKRLGFARFLEAKTIQEAIRRYGV